MKKVNIPLLIVLAFLAGLFGAYAYAHLWTPTSSLSTPHSESAYERVLRTGELRCGYAAWPPLIIKDPNTGVLSGIEHDYIEALGAALKLKIVWAEEVGWGDFPTALESGRIDAFCAGVWPNSSRARQMDFTMPILYQPLYAYARTDDKRFDNNLNAINDPSVTIVAIDGEMATLIATKDFPKAKTLQLAQLSSSSEPFLNVVDKKADIAFTDPATFGEYDAKNSGKVYRVLSKAPVRVFGVTIALAHEDQVLRRMLDNATVELLSSGQIDKIISQYEQYPGALLRVAPPYTTP